MALKSSMLPDLEQVENTVFILVFLGFKSQTFYFWERVLRENCPAVVLSCPLTLSLLISIAATAPFFCRNRNHLNFVNGMEK